MQSNPYKVIGELVTTSIEMDLCLLGGTSMGCAMPSDLLRRSLLVLNVDRPASSRRRLVYYFFTGNFVFYQFSTSMKTVQRLGVVSQSQIVFGIFMGYEPFLCTREDQRSYQNQKEVC